MDGAELIQEHELAAVEQIAEAAAESAKNQDSYVVTLTSYLPKLDQFYIPEWLTMRVLTGYIYSCTPLFSYGAAILSIERCQTAFGFSIDICATMLIASILRISYFFFVPYEVTLLRQSIIMVLVQLLLLRTTLKYRPEEYKYDNLQSVEPFTQLIHDVWFEYFAIRNKPRMFSDEWKNLLRSLSFERLMGFIFKIFLVFVYKFLKFFDPSFKRVGSFWQWNDDRKYWKFLIIFATFQFSFTLLITKVIAWENFAHNVGSLIGGISLLVESLLPLPQISILHKLKSVQGFKIILLISWLCGDTVKLSFLLSLNSGEKNVDTSSLFEFFALFQMGLDFYIGGQYIYYKFYYNPEGTVVNGYRGTPVIGGSQDHEFMELQNEFADGPLNELNEKAFNGKEHRSNSTSKRKLSYSQHLSKTPSSSRKASIGNIEVSSPRRGHSKSYTFSSEKSAT